MSGAHLVCAAHGLLTEPLAQLVGLVDGCRRETDLRARHMSEADTLARTRPQLVELGDLAGDRLGRVRDRVTGRRGDDRGALGLEPATSGVTVLSGSGLGGLRV